MKVLEIIAGTTIGFLSAFGMALIIFNLILGCETWDESRWTETNSCITPMHIWEGIKPSHIWEEITK